ncbi:sigma-E factor regulatory protein RseB domain-containing protein [Blastococcus sp. SYSU D00669]
MLSRRRGAAGRWALVLALVAVLAALPSVVGALPAEDADVSAADLRTAALATADLGFSGYAESAGGLALPVSDELPALADLFSDRTTMRVWWRSATSHRVDVVTPTGETGVHRDEGGSWTWEYEANRATRSGVAPLELPQPPDLLPPTLARRLLSEATDEELSRTGAARVAGRDALGLRLVPADEASSVARIDLWVDAATGLPLQVQLYSEDATNPALDTRFLDLELRRPSAEVVAFTPPGGAYFGRDYEEDVLTLADQRLRTVALPGTLAGLPRRTVAGAPEAIGLYGRGVTLLAVVPVPFRLAQDLRRVADTTPSAVSDELGVRLAAGPVGIMLVGSPGQQSYVLTGTVTLEALEAAARELPELRSRP